MTPPRVYLEPDDDAGSVRARISQAAHHSEPVEVIVPFGQQALRSAVGMLLLRRYIEDAALPVYLITNDNAIRKHARSERVPCYNRTLDGERLLAALRSDTANRTSPGGVDRYTREVRAENAAIRLTLAKAVVTLAAALIPPLAGVWVLGPSATVTLNVPFETVDESLEVTVSTLANAVDATTATLPGRLLEVPVEASMTVPTQVGSAADAQTTAKGRVRLVNRTEQQVRVPAGTRVSTADNVTFTTQSEVLAPPSAAGAVDVAVVADKSGAAGNVKAREITKIDDSQLASRLTVENVTAFTGGADPQERAVTDADFQRLRADILVDAREQALKDIEAKLTGETAVAPGSLRIRITSEELSPRIGTPSDSISLKIKGLARAITFSSEDLRVAVRKRLGITGASNPSGAPTNAQLSVSLGKNLTSDNDDAAFEARVQGTVGRWVDESRIKQAIAGKTANEARRQLAVIAPAVEPAIHLNAFWSDRVPSLQWRITVKQTLTG